MKNMTLVGAGPRFAKAAPFSMIFRQRNRKILVHIGRQYDDNVSALYFDEMYILRPDFIGVGSFSHGARKGRIA